MIRNGWTAALVAVIGLLTVPTTATWAQAPPLQRAEPAAVGFDPEKLAQIDALIEAGLKNKQMPGCVLLIGRQGKIAWLKAYGDKRVLPEREAMTVDTVFDLASLTKPIATATAAMLLVESGEMELNAAVVKYLPQFAPHGKDKITIEQLFLHQGGLIADNALADYQQGIATAWEKIFALKPVAEPGAKFIYSDVSFEVLGKVVETVAKKDLNQFTRERVFQPLGMRETGYRPAESLRQRAAPTQRRNDQWMQGEVHDPRAYLLDGVAGHAGLFSTASDLAIYAQMLLGKGTYRSVQVMKPETVQAMTSPRTVSSGVRGLGWDMQTGFSSNKGKGLSDAAFGHGGFTGTVIWIDPKLDLFYIFLSNRVHPDGKGNVNRLAGEIGSVIAASIK